MNSVAVMMMCGIMQRYAVFQILLNLEVLAKLFALRANTTEFGVYLLVNMQ